MSRLSNSFQRGSRPIRLITLPLLIGMAGCASVPKDGGFADVQQKISPRVAEKVHWIQGAPEDEAVAVEIADLLAQPLTLSGAIQVALLNNPEMQATYERLGVAQADLVQAGLLENPVFTASVRFPDHDRSGRESRTVTREAGGGISLSRSTESATIRNNIEFSLVQNFLDLMTLPMRKQLAEAHFEQAKLALSHDIVHFVGDVKMVYYDYVTAVQNASLLETVTTATDAAAEFAVRQYEAGNLNRLEMSRENGFHAQALLDSAQAELAVKVARERMNRILGIWERSGEWHLAEERLAAPPAMNMSPTGLESFAIANRFDLAASVKELETLVFGVKATRRWRWLGLLDLSVSTERDGDGVYVTGPALELQLPLFDQGQTKIAIAESQLRAGSQRVSAQAIDIRSETREAWERFKTAQESVTYYERVLLPIHQTIVDEASLHYNAMLIGVYDLLMDKQKQIDTARHYVEALHEYWLARNGLELAVGGALPDESLPEAPSDGMSEMTPPADETALPMETDSPTAHTHH